MHILPFFLFALLSAAANAECVGVLTDTNDGSFFNKCFMEQPAGFGTAFSKTVFYFIQPAQSYMIMYAIVAIFLPLVLCDLLTRPVLSPVCSHPSFTSVASPSLASSSSPSPSSDTSTSSSLSQAFLSINNNNNTNQNIEEWNIHSRPTQGVRTYRTLKLHSLQLLHRLVVFQFCFVCALYTMFRQHRPCTCDGKQWGSIYGMPSGDSMVASILASLLLDRPPSHALWARILGFAMIIVIPVERVVLGFHTVGQVVTGTLFGLLFHFYSTRVPQFFSFIDGPIALVAGFIFTSIDDNVSLYAHAMKDNSVRIWFTGSIGFVLFTSLMLARHYIQIYGWRTQELNHALSLPLYSPLHVHALHNDVPSTTYNPCVACDSKVGGGIAGGENTAMATEAGFGGSRAEAAALASDPAWIRLGSVAPNVSLKDNMFTFWCSVLLFSFYVLSYFVEQNFDWKI
eukprot:TRINITY_DN3910_c3_g1_i1.p1 TRINITY_DN3910_c3_g1~~TRINITY_DN3910_c3_g1_i1.p1  ORF type:complete len:476 (+),score=88.56 TRINITY_DN3910_c3_g1_i1:61-1428(+)